MKNRILIWVLIIIIIVLCFIVLFKNSKNAVAPTLPPVEDSNNVANNPTNNVASDCLPTTAPWIKVLSPNGGETFTAGQQITVKWKTCNAKPGQTVGLFIEQPNNIGHEVVSVSFYPLEVTNSGSRNVVLGSSSTNGSWPFVDGSNYRIDAVLNSSRNQLQETPFVQDSSDGTFTINYATNQNNIITKNDWGVSFVKGSDWSVVTNTSSEVSLKQNAGQWIGDIIKINYVSGQSITDTDAKFGNITYFYDTVKKSWMETDNMQGEGIYPHATPVVATTTLYTPEGLPVFLGTGRWKTYIIPISNTTFIKLNIGGSGYSQPLTDLVQTIKKI